MENCQCKDWSKRSAQNRYCLGCPSQVKNPAKRRRMPKHGSRAELSTSVLPQRQVIGPKHVVRFEPLVTKDGQRPAQK